MSTYQIILAIAYPLGCLFCALGGFVIGYIESRAAFRKRMSAAMAILLLLDRLRDEADPDIIIQLNDRLNKCKELIAHDWRRS